MQTIASTFAKAWLFLSSLAAWVLATASAVGGAFRWTALFAAYALAADLAGRCWSRRSPVPMPAFMRWILFAPRGPHSPTHLCAILRPRSGEHVLEIGPGIGIHALPVARALLPDGALAVLDLQQSMLDALMRRATKAGVANIVPTQGNAEKLPYADRTFDAAFLVGVLGEISDPVAALRELRRVMKPGGRLVISELFIDPDFIRLSFLIEMTRRAGFVFERSAGPGLAYSAVFRSG